MKNYNFILKLFLILIVFFPLVSFSQKIQVFYDYEWKEVVAADHARFQSISEKTDSGWYTQVLYINLRKLQMAGLYEDKENKIRNGNFYWAYPNNKFEAMGRYVHNKKEGLWLSFYPDGALKDSANYKNGHPAGISLSWYSNGFAKDSLNMNEDGNGVYVSWFDNGQPSSAGRYTAFDQKHGTWIFFHKNGNRSAAEVYDRDSLISAQYFDENGNAGKKNEDKGAEFPGGPKGWSKYLSKALYFPRDLELVNSHLASVVIVGTVDEEGKVIDARVKVPFHPRFDQIALDAVKKSPAWIPAVSHNRKVYFYFTQSVTFSQGFR